MQTRLCFEIKKNEGLLTFGTIKSMYIITVY